MLYYYNNYIKAALHIYTIFLINQTLQYLSPKCEKSMWQLFKHNRYSVFNNNIYTFNFEIHCDNNQVWQLFKVWRLTSMVYEALQSRKENIHSVIAIDFN